MKFQFLQHRVALSMHFPVFINGLATLGLATVLRGVGNSKITFSHTS